MNIKILVVISVVVLGIGIWFYTDQDHESPPAVLPKPQLNSEIIGIKATQTNPETGEVEYTLTADSLVQDASTGEEVLKNAVIHWQPTADEHYTISAASTVLVQETGVLTLKDGFTLVRLASPQHPEMRIDGGTMQGNINTRKLTSQEPVRVIQAGNEFKASAMQADLNTGNYEFTQIQISFQAPVRNNKPLF